MGFMGARHAKVISELPEARLFTAQDAEKERAKAVANIHKTGKSVNI